MLTLSVSTLTHDKAQPVMASVARDAIGQGLMARDAIGQGLMARDDPSIALDEFD
jgi:hypothetical protein